MTGQIIKFPTGWLNTTTATTAMQVMRYNLSVAYALREEWEKANNLLKEVGGYFYSNTTEHSVASLSIMIVQAFQVMGDLTCVRTICGNHNVLGKFAPTCA